MTRRILQVFNRYLLPGGEEKSVDRIYRHLGTRHETSRCIFESEEWVGAGAPSRLAQARRLFYNREARDRLEEAFSSSGAEIALFHNVYPVGSPALYHAALRRGVPVIQFLHNYRPFSVGGTLFAGGRLRPESLVGRYRGEVFARAWQGSFSKSLLFALMLKSLHRSGWLRSVGAWVAISEFVRAKILGARLVPPERIFALRHAWDPMPELPEIRDDGAYLFLGRLVPEKGVVTALDAWRQLRSQLGDRTPRLELAGDGPLASLIDEYASSNPSVHRLGPLEGAAKREALRRCRAVVVPSIWWEPLGLVVYEAYDFCKPVLAARSGGLTETVFHRETGLLHDSGDSESLAQSVIELERAGGESRARYGRKGREWLLREASAERWMAGFDEIVRSVGERELGS